ncbi:helix-turn-helix domain-containing protein [Ligilactobacillus saerimneri]
MEQPSYYTIIPAPIRYSDAPPREILMYGEITALSNKYGYCTASNSYFSKLYKVNNDTVSSWITDMVNRKWIRRELIKEGKQVKQRRLYLRSLPALQEHGGYPEKTGGVPRKNGVRYPEKTGEGTPKNTEENSTSINNTSNNNSSTTTSTGDNQQEQTAYELIESLGVHFNSVQQDDFLEYSRTVDDGLIKQAVLRAAKKQSFPKWSLIEGILKTYLDHSIRTAEEAKAFDKEYEDDMREYNDRRREYRKNQYRPRQTNYQATGAVDFLDPRRLDEM